MTDVTKQDVDIAVGVLLWTALVLFHGLHYISIAGFVNHPLNYRKGCLQRVRVEALDYLFMAHEHQRRAVALEGFLRMPG